MAKDSSATVRQEAPHSTQTTHVNPTTRTAAIIDVLKRRAQTVLNDTSIDAQSRAIIRYGLETNDPWLAELVRRADGGESLAETFDFSESPEINKSDRCAKVSEGEVLDGTAVMCRPSKEKIEALAEIICGGGAEAAGALFVLMGTLVDATHPKAVANTVKHFAFTRCGELNLFGMVDAQIAVVEGELLTRGVGQ